MEANEECNYPNNILFFRMAVTNNFKHIAESVSENEFLEILTTMKSNPKVARKLHKAMEKELYTGMNDDFEAILNDGSLQKGWERIARLSNTNSPKEDAWRPPGNINLHMRSLDAQTIKEESELLEKQVNEIEHENAILMKKIEEKRSKINTIYDKITWTLNKSPIAIESLRKRQTDLDKCLKLLNQE